MNKQFLQEQIELWKNIVNNSEKGSFPEIYRDKNLAFLSELGTIQHPIDRVKSYLQNDNCKFSKEEILRYLNSFAYDVHFMPEVTCFESIYKNCTNCSKCCSNEDSEPCEQWTPCRGGHTSTPNPCELQNLADYDLFLGICKYCDKCPKDFDTNV